MHDSSLPNLSAIQFRPQELQDRLHMIGAGGDWRLGVKPFGPTRRLLVGRDRLLPTRGDGSSRSQRLVQVRQTLTRQPYQLTCLADQFSLTPE